ncbi:MULTISPECIES: DUF3147 family protein [unclassified Methylophaga]|jgi:hypothetical protein|uniref:DUF3147 family protein n=1 Tax=unclassified Methylophaga TaxID=2629249 RepID=UPI000C938EFF|nr:MULTISPECIES: DUF3147 family protein [unclassified Methylophaga]MAK65487.1 hypothetical protein [Methylophaga sp.]MAY16210.1 hypothetical protein [Methylophaga sp.]|tara:strand:- start:15359 stop:15709 length:351 start_codon:yes stop_codon:yes gene_type:complete
MWYYITKVFVSAVVIVVISEVAKRSSIFGAIIASVPLISVIAIIWLYQETGDVTKISILASNIFWLVLPSLALFITLPILLNMGLHFYLSLLIAVCVTVISYYFMLLALRSFGIDL